MSCIKKWLMSFTRRSTSVSMTNEKGRETAGTLEDSQKRTHDFSSCRKELWGSRRSASPDALLTFSLFLSAT